MNWRSIHALWNEFLCWALGHDFFVIVYDEEGYPRRKCERCGVWAIPKEHRRVAGG